MSVKYGICVTTYNKGAWLDMTLRNLHDWPHVYVADTLDFGGNLHRTWNQALRMMFQAGHEVAIITNDDVIFRPDTAALLARGLFEPAGWTERELLLLSARHASDSDARTNEPDWDRLAAKRPEHQPGPDFACFACTPPLLEQVGEFDEGFQVYCGDNDMHRRIQLAGFEAGAYAPYWHLLNGTIRANAERQAAVHAIFERDVAHYREKWGGWLGEERFSTPYGRVA